ncbi:hypothetical protein T492DRAFT_381493 [Pavlovales sp. CCMP2436]|nr:hypothetical protein T492DRAFT_381493 [Pavlovales sp. CCMP2436]
MMRTCTAVFLLLLLSMLYSFTVSIFFFFFLCLCLAAHLHRCPVRDRLVWIDALKLQVGEGGRGREGEEGGEDGIIKQKTIARLLFLILLLSKSYCQWNRTEDCLPFRSCIFIPQLHFSYHSIHSHITVSFSYHSFIRISCRCFAERPLRVDIKTQYIHSIGF